MKRSEEKYFTICSNMKKDILDLCHRSGKGKAHLGGCMSLVEILAVLYTDIMYLGAYNDVDAKRDRLILSKGHGALALYAALRQAGKITEQEMQLPVRGEKTFLYRHPKMNLRKGIEVSSGSLGLGLPYGVGIAYALKKKYAVATPKVFVILGDGECNEGAVWEAAALAASLNLENLTVIVDKNNLQLDGSTKDIVDMRNLSEKWQSFGFYTLNVDGHSCEKLAAAFHKKSTLPKAVIADTVKGKGISFAENRVEWHDNYLSDTLYEIAQRDIEGIYNGKKD
ncbi:transketolase [Mediterraneibacter agrestimuris]|uniref:transketolase n=1 Tax=Mediterraneibacter agrestimuris TaxID=2941333 RepID=UPI002041E722|nr:thiamine pyrophosphate-dependent enzyme [Mediterraneibacter agrestimuris]